MAVLRGIAGWACKPLDVAPSLSGQSRILIPGHDRVVLAQASAGIWSRLCTVVGQLASQGAGGQISISSQRTGTVSLSVTQACRGGTIDISAAILDLVCVTSDEQAQSSIALRVMGREIEFGVGERDDIGQEVIWDLEA